MTIRVRVKTLSLRPQYNDPVNWVDPLGLTELDVTIALQLARDTQKDMKFPEEGYNYADLGKDPYGNKIVGVTDLALAEQQKNKDIDFLIYPTTLDGHYLNNLSQKEAIDLLDTIIHEGVHYTLDRDDINQLDYEGGYPYTETKRRMTQDLIYEFLRRRKKACP